MVTRLITWVYTSEHVFLTLRSNSFPNDKRQTTNYERDYEITDTALHNLVDLLQSFKEMSCINIGFTWDFWLQHLKHWSDLTFLWVYKHPHVRTFWFSQPWKEWTWLSGRQNVCSFRPIQSARQPRSVNNSDRLQKRQIGLWWHLGPSINQLGPFIESTRCISFDYIKDKGSIECIQGRYIL